MTMEMPMPAAGLSAAALLRPEGFACPCGRHHRTDLKMLRIGRGAVNALPDVLKELGAMRAFLVADLNTWDAAGARAAEALDAAGFPYTLCRFETRERLMPAEWELGSLTMRFDPACDIFVAVGGGVINDLCKMMARATGRPTVHVGTAPSMDGFASDSGSMEVGGIKKTIYTPCPSAVICDTEIMAQAPRRMLLAGVGDMIAKYTSICDWRVSHLVNGEYYCERVAGMMRTALQRVIDNLDGVMARDPDAVGAVAEGLVLAGMAMAFAQVSRPASGVEHSFSHIWEMMALDRGRPYDLHGIQVGIGTMLALPIYARARAITPSMARVEEAIAAFDETAWEANVRRVFGGSAQALIDQAAKQKKNDPDARRARAKIIIDHWDEICAIYDEELPDVNALRAKMEAIGLPMTPADINLTHQDAIDAFVCSRDSRGRYLLSSMLWDIGELETGADALRAALEGGA